MKKRVLAMLLSMAMTATLLAGCGSSSDSTGDTTDGDGAKEYDVLRVAMMPFGGNVPAQYAYDQGYFEELGLNIEFYQLQTVLASMRRLLPRKSMWEFLAWL
mgnify:CR=1 FL=1